MARPGRRGGGRRGLEMTAIVRGQVLKCRWVEPPPRAAGPHRDEHALPVLGEGGTLRVVLARPPRPAVIDLEQGDALYMFETRQTWRVALFAPDMYRLARGGLVQVEAGI